MKKVWVTAFSFALSLPAYAIDIHSHRPSLDSVCFPEAKWKELLGKAAIAEHGDVWVVDGKSANSMVKAYNDIPPIGNIQAEEILIVYSTESAAFVMIHDGKGCGVQNFKPAYFFAWINTAFPHNPNVPAIPYSIDSDYVPNTKDI